MSGMEREHDIDVQPHNLRQLSQRQVDRLLTPKSIPGYHKIVTVPSLLWSLGLHAYDMRDGGGLLIGFGFDEDIHDHDRWLFHSASPGQRWRLLEVDEKQSFRTLVGFANYQDVTRAERAEDKDGDYKFLTHLAQGAQYTVEAADRGWGVNITKRTALLASRIEGAMDGAFLRNGQSLTFKDAHDLVYHFDDFKAKRPRFKNVPQTYMRTLHGLTVTALAEV